MTCFIKKAIAMLRNMNGVFNKKRLYEIKTNEVEFLKAKTAMEREKYAMLKLLYEMVDAHGRVESDKKMLAEIYRKALNSLRTHEAFAKMIPSLLVVSRMSETSIYKLFLEQMEYMQ